MEVFKKKIISHLRHRDYRPVQPAVFAKSLGIKPDELDDFKKAFAQLRSEGLVIIGSKNLVSFPPAAGTVYGTFRGTTKGFGFVTPTESNNHGDLFIPAGKTADAMTGDSVVAEVLKKSQRDGQGRCSGKIIEIVRRANDRFVGTVTQKGDFYYLLPDGKFTEPVELDDVGAKGAQPGDKAVVEVITYPTEQNYARGVIIELLGKGGTYKAETEAVIRRFSLPGAFDEKCIKAASEASKNFNPSHIKNRLDLTGKTIITIDPQDAKDFDDAISIDRNPDDTFTLGIHIADVSYFVRQDSPLDIEAKERGNSVYLPGLVIPMLPEVLSNGVCSLQPGQKRLAKSAFITYDKSANIVKTTFAESIICSSARLTYTEADNILKGKKTEKSAEAVSLLKDMDFLARLIESRRRTAGMLHLDLPETELVFDKAGRVVDAHPADTSWPHTIIEMFMVEANEAVGSLLNGLNIPFIRRIHPDPDSLSLQSLAKTIKMFGVSVPKNPDIYDLQDVINKVRDKPAAYAVNVYVLRSLARAEYSPLNIGHFALASRHYTHFTSPIRRYADLLIHRLLEIYIRDKTINEQNVLSNAELVETGNHLSFTDRRAEEAEDDLKTVLILQFMQNRLGETLDTVISGLTNFGIFVQCTKFGVEGLIPLEQLGTDRFVYDHQAQCVYGTRNGRMFHIGMPLKVKIVSVNLAARQLNVLPIAGQVEKQETKKEKFKKHKDKDKKRKFGKKGHKDRNKKGRR
ncbi:MAG: ribonuclease R [Phycisphaerae bacterium]|nr:ribonuclease R [Phycisphaerae bacterium]